ncbi:hypothetical protein BJV78DRAFT_1158578 [Lactifluus subvellereus]|nr:hypothetical protein BJV78DRAFT_1158578 [Lactifluus subvellereus]
MDTRYQAEKAFRQQGQSEKTLKQYKIAVLQELCVKHSIQVDVGGLKHLKKPYINALLTHEPSTVQFMQPTAVEHSHSTVNTFHIPHESTPPVIPTSPQMDMALALTHHQEHIIPTANADPTLDPASRTSEVAIPSKQSYPFNKDVPRKKRKTERYVNDLEHTNEIEYALTLDGGLDLVDLSQKLNLKGCQASQLSAILICVALAMLTIPEGSGPSLLTAMV